MIRLENLSKFFQGVSLIFEEKKEELCQMDAYMGDGDLGLTMSKGFGALPLLIEENKEEDLAKTLMKAGMKMASLVPSTMGTLMASGIMEGAKKLKGHTCIDREELVLFLEGFYQGIEKRGKCKVGERTLLDAMYPAYEEAKRSWEENESFALILEAACEGAKKGLEKTKTMLPKYGKAAVFAGKALGVEDQGAKAGYYLLRGLADYEKKKISFHSNI